MSKNLPALPDDLRKELLAEQADQITSQVTLPRIKIMPAGAGLFEFSDSGDTARDFAGVVLNSHGRNVLWPRPYGVEAGPDEPDGPGCVADDGQAGTPREGFDHAALGEVATGTESVACSECNYNQWGSATLVGKGGNGKACTNQRAVYVMIEGRELPYELTLPPTSIREYDSYLANLLNEGTPVQAVVTKFSQEKIQKGALEWAIAKFENTDALSDENFALVRERRAKYMGVIAPRTVVEAEWTTVEDDEDETPF